VAPKFQGVNRLGVGDSRYNRPVNPALATAHDAYLLACVAGMTLKPLIRWLSILRLPPGLSAALVLCLLGVWLGHLLGSALNSSPR